LNTPRKYQSWLAALKADISACKLQTALQVNSNMLILYWYIGRQIDEKIKQESWGSRIIEQLSADLQKTFPDLKGFSTRNLLYMQQFSVAYPGLLITQQPVAQLGKTSKSAKGSITQQPVAQLGKTSKSAKGSITQQPVAQLGKTSKSAKGSITQQPVAQLGKTSKSAKDVITQQPVAQLGQYMLDMANAELVGIPWGHHTLLLDKIETSDERAWYIKKTIENKWSRTVLQYQLQTDLYKRQHKTKKASNFHLTLPKVQSELANAILKGPYKFDFLSLGDKFTERELEQQLVHHVQDFLIELGAGFAFVGRQYKLKAGRKEHYIDLLFYHLYLRSYVVIELKLGEFELEHTGQMNGYLNMVNAQLRQPHDNPTIGIILCSSKDSVEVDFALNNIAHPIGVSDYAFSKSLPRNLRDKLPGAKQLQDEVKRFWKSKKIK
jgi:predicted nuclease of restriction endonuclease-like (RecB) superfamily